MFPIPDSFQPPNHTQLGDFDNYQIYDLVVGISTIKGSKLHYYPASHHRTITNSNYPVAAEDRFTSDDPIIYTGTPYGTEITPDASLGSRATCKDFVITEDNTAGGGEQASTLPDAISRRVYAVQRYSVNGQTDTSSLIELFDQYPPIPPRKQVAKVDIYEPRIITGYSVGGYPYTTNSYGLTTEYEHRTESPVFSWERLIVPHVLTFSAVASVSGVFTFSYWGVNVFENHPLIDYTLDYFEQEIELVKGKKFTCKLLYPVAETVAFPQVLLSHEFANSQGINLTDIILGSSGYRTSLQPIGPIGSIDSPPATALTVSSWLKHLRVSPSGFISSLGIGDTYSLVDPISGRYIDELETTIPQFLGYKSLLANNGNWQKNPTIATQIYPTASPEDLPIYYPSDIENWHFKALPNNHYGEIIMDSPRTLEIYEQVQIIFRALNAGRYGEKDPTTDEYPVINYSLLIEKIAAILGHRPDVLTGKHVIAKEQETVRQLLPPGASLNKQDYGGKYYGDKGMLLKRLPNQFSQNGNIAAGGVVAVHDLPQLLLEILDQLAIATGLQESGAIEIKDGSNTRRYPNQLELMRDIALTASATHQLAHQAFISGLVTQKQTAELIGGLGLPTISRSINAVLNNKIEQVPYWGISPQASIARKIDTVGYNVGVVLGQII